MKYYNPLVYIGLLALGVTLVHAQPTIGGGSLGVDLTLQYEHDDGQKDRFTFSLTKDLEILKLDGFAEASASFQLGGIYFPDPGSTRFTYDARIKLDFEPVGGITPPSIEFPFLRSDPGDDYQRTPREIEFRKTIPYDYGDVYFIGGYNFGGGTTGAIGVTVHLSQRDPQPPDLPIQFGPDRFSVLIDIPLAPTPVPEPSTYGVFASIGMIGLVAWRRIRAQRNKTPSD